jgi:cellulose synthase/poly-beta-1,6-N-acetylglucosamine synthase-like glycosyltransferase
VLMMLSWVTWVLVASYGMIVLRWLWGHWELTQAARSRLIASAQAANLNGPPPRVTVVIAAHNEANTIGQCLASILGQGYPNLQVIVANDRSTDGTGDIVRAVARDHPHVRCMDIGELPGGWLGKTHAVSVATRQADGEYLVFTDSDVIWHPSTLTAALSLARQAQLDFLSIWPRVIVASFWERLLLPACAYSLSLWFRRGRSENDEATPAYANGAFLVVRRDAYDRIGGHESVPTEMAEDVSLAKRARDAGLRRRLVLGSGMIRTRMHENLGQIIHGWTRIFIGALGARWKLAVGILLAVIGSLTPFIVAIALAIVAGKEHFGIMEWVWAIMAGLHLVAMYSVVYRYVGMAFEGGAYVLLFPVGLLGVIALLVYCLLVSSGIGVIRWGQVAYQVQGSRAIRRRETAR